MAVTTELKGIKLVLDLEKGSQTIAGCSETATNDALNSLALAVGGLTQYPVEQVVKVEETILIQE